MNPARLPQLLLLTALVVNVQQTVFAQSTSDRKLTSLRERHVRLQATLEEEADKIVEWCNERGLVGAAARTRKLTDFPDPRSLTEANLPREKQPIVPPGAVGDERLWHTKVKRARTAYATEVYRLSRSALRYGFPSYAMELIQEVAHHDPDHTNARRLLGYVEFHDKKRTEPDYLGEWVTPFEKKMRGALKRRVWSDKYGWVRASHLEKYEQGLRPWNNSWITAEKEHQIRRDFRNAWVIETEHFRVKTNHSLERGVEIASKLEDFYAFFRRTFATFFETPEQFQERFNNSRSSNGRRATPEQMEVHYFRSKEEYVEKLIRKEPRISITNGYYFASDKTSYFFHSADGGDATLFHEATHQFFDIPTRQHRSKAAQIRRAQQRSAVLQPWVIAENSNFWIIEAIACYMESFEQTETGYSLGAPNYERFRAAHFRLTDTKYYVPFRDFSSMGMREFQSSPNIAMNYTQGSGLAHFLMHYEGGQYRDGLIAFIGKLYRPDRNNLLKDPSLEKTLGVTFEQLDNQYKEHITNLYLSSQEPAPSR